MKVIYFENTEEPPYAAEPPNQTVHRGFRLSREGQYLLWEVIAREDGKGARVPTSLLGKWTTLEMIKNHIDAYLFKQQGNSLEEVDNGHDNNQT